MMAIMNGWEIVMLGTGALVFGLLATVFWAWMLVDAVRNRGLAENERIVWVVVIAITQVIGALLYLIFARSKQNLAPVIK